MLQWRNGFGLFCHVHHQPDAGRVLCIQLVYPRYLLEELFPCCVWYLEPLRSSPNANTSTFVFSLSLPPRLVWCQQTRMKKKKKKGWESAGKKPFTNSLCGPHTETTSLHHLLPPSVTSLQQTELTGADLPLLNRLPHLLSVLSQRIRLSRHPGSSWVIRYCPR